MKFFVFIFTVLSLSLAYATTPLDQFFQSSEATKMCQSFIYEFKPGVFHNKLILVRADAENVYFAVRQNRGSKLISVSLQTGSQTEQLFERRIVDLKIQDEELLILTTRELTVIDQVSDLIKFRTKTLPTSLSYRNSALAMAITKINHLYHIAHGAHGLITYNSMTQKHERQFMPLVPQPETGVDSLVSGITHYKNKLFLALDNNRVHSSSRGFEGIVEYDYQNSIQTGTYVINQRGESYHKPTLSMDGDDLIVHNMHLLFRHDTTSLGTRRYLEPDRRVWNYQAGLLKSQGLVKNKKSYGCFKNSKQEVSAGAFSHF